MAGRPLVSAAVSEPAAMRAWSFSRGSQTGASLAAAPGSAEQLHRGARSSPASSSSDDVPSGVAPLYDPAFSPRRHAAEILARALPALPAKDADAALAALDATESDLRAQRDAARANEEAARDQLRRALQDSVKVRAGTLLDADQADEAVAAAGDTGNGVGATLTALIEPLRVAKVEKEDLCNARDMIALLATGESLDVVRSAEVLASATALLQSTDAAAIIDGDVETLSTARTKVKACVDDLAAALCSSVVRGITMSDTATVRACISAGRKLGGSIETDVVIAAVESMVSAAGHAEVAASSTDLFNDEFFSRKGTWLQSLCPRVATALHPVLEAQDTAVEAARDIASQASEWFPDPANACMLAIEFLLERFIIGACEKFQKVFRDDLGKRESEAYIAETEFNGYRKSRSTTSSVAVSEAHRSFIEASRRLRVARSCFLDALASSLCVLSRAREDIRSVVEFCGVAASVSAPGHLRSTTYARESLLAYLEREVSTLRDELRFAFGEASRVDAHSQDSNDVSSRSLDGMERYRVSYVRIVSALPHMTANAIHTCHTALLRCTLACGSPSCFGDHSPHADLVPNTDHAVPRSGSNVESPPISDWQVYSKGLDLSDAMPIAGGPIRGAEEGRNLSSSISAHWEATVEKFCHVLLDEYISACSKLLNGAFYLLPPDEVSPRDGDTWASGSSPVASFCKAVKYLFESNRLVDAFLTNYNKLPTEARSQHEAENEILTRENRSTKHFEIPSTVSAQSHLRRSLRSRLRPISAKAEEGLHSAVAAAGKRVASIVAISGCASMYSDVSIGNSTVASFSDGVDFAYDVDFEPSMPFISACAFLEQQAAVLKSTLPQDNVGIMLDLLALKTCHTVLDQWRRLSGPLSVQGGLQMTADGRALVEVFGTSLGPESELNGLPALGTLYSSSLTELPRILESKALSKLNAEVLIDFLRKRPESQTGGLEALVMSLKGKICLEQTDEGL